MEHLQLLSEAAVEGFSQTPAASDTGFSYADGPYSDCFSARRLVHLFLWGATAEDFLHLQHCEWCRLKTTRYAAITRQTPVTAKVAAAQASFRERVRAVFAGKAAPQPVPATAALYLAEPTIRVKPPYRQEVPLTAVVISGTEKDTSALDESTFHLEGPVVADHASLELTTLEHWISRVPQIRFTAAHLAPYIQKDLGKHFRVTDTIRVVGHFKDRTRSKFVGRANGTFERG